MRKGADVMRVRLIPDAADACAHYRIQEPARVLRADDRLDLDVGDSSVHYLQQLGASLGYDERGLYVASLSQLDCDVLVLQRPFHRHLVEAIPLAQAQGVAVVVELDDALDSLDVEHPLFDRVQPSLSPDWNFRWLRKAMFIADAVTVTTNGIARTVGHDRVSVIPNYVAGSWVEAGRRRLATRARRTPVIGWHGALASHPGDLDVARPAVKELVDVALASFGSVGDHFTPVYVGVPGRTEPWCGIDELPGQLGSFDVGIVALRLSAFNEAKSWLKGLEYAACGVAFVATPTEPYLDLSRRGAGVLAGDERQWLQQLTRLVTNRDYRLNVADKAHAAAAKLTIEAHAGEWVDAWDMALAHRQAVAA